MALLKVKEEFEELTKNAAAETAELQSRIADLEEDLSAAKANTESNQAGVALEHKKALDKITADYEDKLKKAEKKLEKLQKQVDDLMGKSGGQDEEIKELQGELAAAKKENTAL